jgi:hypothetical protein
MRDLSEGGAVASFSGRGGNGRIDDSEVRLLRHDHFRLGLHGGGTDLVASVRPFHDSHNGDIDHQSGDT